MKGRDVLPSHVMKYGTDQDRSIVVEIRTTNVGQQVLVISIGNNEIALTPRQAVDLQHKLGKVIIDWLMAMVPMFLGNK